MEKIIYSVSIKVYKTKLKDGGFPFVKYKKESCYLDEVLIPMCDYIREGRVFAHNYNVIGETFNAKGNINKRNFINTFIIALDLDKINSNHDDINRALTAQPSIIYSTFSHEDKDKFRRYRLIYVFNNPIENEDEFHKVYSALAKGVYEDMKGIDVLDDKKLDSSMDRTTQVWIGSRSDCELINNFITYDKRRFIGFDNCNASDSTSQKEVIKKRKVKANVENNSSINSTQNNKCSDITCSSPFYILKWKDIIKEYEINNQDFIDEVLNSISDNCFKKENLISKYRKFYPIFEDEKPNYINGYANLDVSFMSIIRIWEKNKITGKKHIKKTKQGGRKAYLFKMGLRFLKMRDISFDYLLFLLINEVYAFCENEINFSIKDILEVANNAFQANRGGNNNIFFAENHQKIKIDKDWCKENNIKPNSMAKIVRGIETDKKIGEFYDGNLGVKENLQILKENGVSICKSRLYEYRNKYYPKNKYEEGNNSYLNSNNNMDEINSDKLANQFENEFTDHINIA